MKKFRNTFRAALALILALTVTLSMAFTAFAEDANGNWSTYNGNQNHNGQISTATLTSNLGTLTSSNLSVISSLPKSGSGWSGVDTQAVMETVGSTTYAYVIYNAWSGGGVLAKINCNTATVVGTVTLTSGNTFQLSTPYLDTANRCIYAATNNGSVYKITGLDTTLAATSIFTGASGQINTPVVKYGNYIYFGSWVGNGTPGGATAPGNYYQVDVSGTTYTSKTVSSGGARGFYWAGAYSDGTYVYFGGDDGKFYYRSVANFNTVGGTINLTSYNSNVGDVRSSVSTDGTYLYFTSKGSGSNGYLWRTAISTLTSSPSFTSVQLNGTSTSTPAISANGYIYVGYYNGFTSGGVQAVQASTFSSSSTLYTVSTAGPVQSSPIVYTDLNDYVYFTTNSSTGSGYCYEFDGSSGTQMWQAAGTSSNRYALQGFSATGGYLIYGDDGDYLYIVH